MRKTKYLVFCLIAAGSIFCIHELGANNMFNVKFSLGQNIVETAKKSGAPRWSTRNIQGFISYDLVGMPSDIPLVYQRPDYEVTAMPVYSFTMYADKERNNDLAVESTNLLFAADALTSHLSAKTFVEGLISQFQRGKWKRHVDELCPAVSGRSSFLNEAGQAHRSWSCPLDPEYRLSPDDWIMLMYMEKSYEWLGDGVLATLNIGYSDDIRGITYSIQLKFEDFAGRKRRDEMNRLRDLAEGDANGWKSTENEAKGIAERKRQIKVLEENALKRGDRVISR